MIYLWGKPEYCPNKDIAVYDEDCSPNYFLLRKGTMVDPAIFGRCYAYSRTSLVDLADDVFIRTVVRNKMQSAYIFTREGMFSFAGGIATRIKITADNLRKIKTALSLTDENIDKEPKILSDANLETIDAIIGHPILTRTPIFHLSVTKAMIQKKYDCIPNNSSSPLVNHRTVNLLLKLVPEDVQFFDAEVRCKDSVLTDYKLLNLTRTIMGIDHERSIYSLIKSTDAILGFKYLAYKPDCMEKYKFARDKEYLSNILVTEEIKQIFEKEKIKGARFVRPEVFYRPLEV